MDVLKFKQLPILGILRGIEPEALAPLVETICLSGLKTIEITMNTKSAVSLISQAVKLSRGRLCVGAGTVLNKDLLKQALDSGATFCVTPVLVEEVSRHCLKNKVPLFTGAFSPKEIFDAWQSGATMVKVFPAKFFGQEYLKEIKGPFNDIELLACGGVTAENVRSYFANGASAVSFGASVFRKDWLTKKDFNSIGNSIRDFVANFKA